jgi:hypothetical protein
VSRRFVIVPRVLGPWLLATLVACTTAAGAPSPSITESPPAPSATTGTSPSPSETSSPPPEASPSPTPPSEPPPATLRGTQGSGVVGDVGTYTLGTFGSDAPWLPGEPAEVAPGEQVTIDVPGVTIESWMARIGTAPDTDVRGLAEGSGLIAFEAPESGSWSLSVRVQFAGGDVSYYWALTVR